MSHPSARSVSATFCVTGETVLNVVSSQAHGEYVFAFSCDQQVRKSSQQGGRYGWVETQDLNEVYLSCMDFLFLIPKRLILGDDVFVDYIKGTEESQKPHGWLSLLNAGGLLLPLGYMQRSSLISTNYLMRYKMPNAQVVGAHVVYKRIRAELKKICDKTAGIGQFPSFPYTIEKIRFEPGLEEFISRDHDFVEFLK